MLVASSTHAWAGTFQGLVTTSAEALIERLCAFVADATSQQVRAWREEIEVLHREGAVAIAQHPPASNDATVLEYQLPRAGGRRPDVVVLQNGRVVVLEFKQTGQLRRVDLDQVAAYARDLSCYHSACGDVELVPMLVLCGPNAVARQVNGVRVVPADQLARSLVELARASSSNIRPDLDTFLGGEYAPLPTLVAAARLLFNNLPLPHIKRARSAGVHTAVERIQAETRSLAQRQQHRLVLVTGVPGAGKTLVGLQVAHSAALEQAQAPHTPRRRGAPATFLSGNGPLVQVLQHALRSTSFVQDMHGFIREHGLQHPDRIPSERVIVFDEAQRAWDRPKIADFYGARLPNVHPSLFASEPELLIRIASRMPSPALVLALVGHGQEIHTGEEAGMDQWADAIAAAPQSWSVLGPPGEAERFAMRGIPFDSADELNLNTGLRYHAAADLHEWVTRVLDQGDLDSARDIAVRLRDAAYPIYLTRDLDAAKAYLRDRWPADPERRYGILASSKSERHLNPYGLATGFQATKRIRVGEWFNAEPTHPRSCCQLADVVTEFQCQGLELDLAMLAWSNDLTWSDARWTSKAARRQGLVRDPHRLRINAYRVLLTRGREGLVIWVPDSPAESMDATAAALVRAGAIEVRATELRAAA